MLSSWLLLYWIVTYWISKKHAKTRYLNFIVRIYFFFWVNIFIIMTEIEPLNYIKNLKMIFKSSWIIFCSHTCINYYLLFSLAVNKVFFFTERDQKFCVYIKSNWKYFLYDPMCWANGIKHEHKTWISHRLTLTCKCVTTCIQIVFVYDILISG